jgi:ATP-dependent DNA ligase
MGEIAIRQPHVEQYGTTLFERVCKMDLEGIVAKHSFGNYVTERERTTWFKIRAPNKTSLIAQPTKNRRAELVI